MSLPPGTSLGPYTIVAALGAGGMGEVYRARDERLEREVAIKVLPRGLRDSAELAARFQREARTLSQLNHPHICTLHDVGHDDGIDYLVLELIAGETLAARLLRGALPVDELLEKASQLVDALAAAHAAGLVHRDLKPGNLMLTAAGLKLLDFGLARPALAPPAAESTRGASSTVAAPLTNAGALVGTFAYMAPEQLEGREADERSDLFALGCVLHEMATGQRPFAGNDLATRLGSMLRARPAPPSRLNGTMPRGLDRIVSRCLEKDPAERPAGAAAVAAELAALRRWPRDEGLPELMRPVRPHPGHGGRARFLDGLRAGRRDRQAGAGRSHGRETAAGLRQPDLDHLRSTGRPGLRCLLRRSRRLRHWPSVRRRCCRSRSRAG